MPPVLSFAGSAYARRVAVGRHEPSRERTKSGSLLVAGRSRVLLPDRDDQILELEICKDLLTFFGVVAMAGVEPCPFVDIGRGIDGSIRFCTAHRIIIRAATNKKRDLSVALVWVGLVERPSRLSNRLSLTSCRQP